MKKNITLKKSLIKNRRGASMVEYALLLVAILLVAAAIFKKLGASTGSAATRAGAEL